MIASRLPTRQAAPWRKALAQWDTYQEARSFGTPKKPRPKMDVETLWPIESTLFVYPGKVGYGQGESILWELKLFGKSADHGIFLEVILPAMEEAGYTSDPQWKKPDKLWGRFDIQAVYVARGARWEPLVHDGRLNLRYRASPSQWAEGLALDPAPERTFGRLTWVTPVDLAEIPASGDLVNPSSGVKETACHKMPTTLRAVLESLVARFGRLASGQRRTAGDVLEDLPPEERSGLQNAIEQADCASVISQALKPVPRQYPGQWKGVQVFDSFPDPVFPYLQLASIFHVGRQTHFGCGTFTLT